MRVARISISDLTSPTLTRHRGRIAADRLEKYLGEHESVELDVREDRPVSLSFLDEIVWTLRKSDDIDRLTFVTDRADIVRKLERIAYIRNVNVHKRDPSSRKRTRVDQTPPVPRRVVTHAAKPTSGGS